MEVYSIFFYEYQCLFYFGWRPFKILYEVVWRRRARFGRPVEFLASTKTGRTRVEASTNSNQPSEYESREATRVGFGGSKNYNRNPLTKILPLLFFLTRWWRRIFQNRERVFSKLIATHQTLMHIAISCACIRSIWVWCKPIDLANTVAPICRIIVHLTVFALLGCHSSFFSESYKHKILTSLKFKFYTILYFYLRSHHLTINISDIHTDETEKRTRKVSEGWTVYKI